MIRAGQDMRHITLSLMREDLPGAGLVLAETASFAPDERPLLEAELPEVPGKAFRDRIRRAWGHFDRLVALLGDLPRDDAAYPPAVPHRERIIEIGQWLSDAWEQCAPCEEKQHEIEDQSRELDELALSLEQFRDLDVDLGQLREAHEHVDMRIGTVPSANFSRLNDILALSKHVVVKLSEYDETLRILIAGRHEDADVLDSVLHAAAFQPLMIPESFDDNPDALRHELTQRRQQLQKETIELEAHLNNWAEANRAQLMQARQLLEAAEPYVNLRGAVRTRGPLAALQGWVPASVLQSLQDRLGNELRHPFVLDARRPRRDERHLVPVPTQNRGLLHPFSILVQQYGVPRFGEFDPTVLFAVTYVGMFGMMFGDVGHGAVIMLLGFLLRHKIGVFTRFFALAGASSIVFGFLYGSVFGVEHWIHPLWIAPMSDPIYMLTVALIWGVAFLTLGSIIAISNRFLSGDQAAALFGPGGIVSLVLYLALLGGLVSMAQGKGFPLAATILSLLALAVLIVAQWRSSEGSIGERIFTTIIETFEIVNNYVASSLSFLRVAAFSLNHVALSLAVFTLADGMGFVGHWITLILGNIFIIVLEGVIVTIQTLRLEYYEGFSRYFYGDGTPFRPLRVGRSTMR